MREQRQAVDLRVGDLAFLPADGGLRKARVVETSVVGTASSHVAVEYELVAEKCRPRTRNLCYMNPSSWYEVYVRPLRPDKRLAAS